MSELSEIYVLVRSEAISTRELDPEITNRQLRNYRELLNEFKFSEKKSDGGTFKVWVLDVDEFNSELSADKRTLLFSHKLKLNIYDSYPHESNNYLHHVMSKINQELQKIEILPFQPTDKSGKIHIKTTGMKVPGDSTDSSRWPRDRLAGIVFG